MKRLIFIMLLGLAFSCQEEELTVIEGQDDSSFLQDEQLTGLMKGVASHDGSYDDVIDSSSCFSIDFPYEVSFNGEIYTINTIEDLSTFNKGDKVVPVFPINITGANYVGARIAGQAAFEEYIERCANGQMYNQRITCVDFVYPVNIAVYNPTTSNFDVMSLLHDKQTFLTIEDMDRALVANIRYPITLNMSNGTSVEIDSDNDLKTTISGMIPFCE